MTRAYSGDLRARVLADLDSGATASAAAARFAVSPAWVRRLRQRRREAAEVAGPPAPRRPPGPARLMAGPGDEAPAALARAEPDLCASGFRDRLGEAAAGASVATVWRALRRLGLTLKKK